MSDDLIARLEARSRWTNLNVSDGDLFRQAAAEIRTLRAEREQFAQNANCSEVAAIVAWLRSPTGKWPRATSHADLLAQAIERGEYKESGK